MGTEHFRATWTTTRAVPTSLTVGDFNGDGKLDLAVADSIPNTVSILLGNGDGTFQPRVPYSVDVLAVSVTAGDFNSDGKLDLAVATQNSNSISILLGNGDGTFGPTVSYAAGSAPASVAAADLNGDGKLDLALTNRADNTVSILLGNGDGTFSPRSDYATGSNPWSLAAGDFNRDGRMDLAVANFDSNTVSVLLQVPIVSLSPASLNFSNQSVGTTSAAQPVTMTNTGSALLTIRHYRPHRPQPRRFWPDQRLRGHACRRYKLHDHDYVHAHCRGRARCLGHDPGQRRRQPAKHRTDRFGHCSSDQHDHHRPSHHLWQPSQYCRLCNVRPRRSHG